jgi:hypothetical protein
MASMIAFGVYDVVLGSRILGGGARKGGMPLYKYVANRCRFGRREHVRKPQIGARQVEIPLDTATRRPSCLYPRRRSR